MKSTLLELVTSKKFLAAVAAIVVYVAGRFGFSVDPSTLDHVFAALLVYVGAQGAADIGKSAAQIKAVTATAGMTTESSDALKRIATSAVIVGLVGIALVACAEVKPKLEAAKGGTVHCVKADTGPLLALTGELGAAALASALHVGKPDWDALVDKALGKGLDIGGCAFAALYHAFDLAEPEAAARSIAAAPDPRRTALERLRAQLGGVRWELADGSVL